MSYSTLFFDLDDTLYPNSTGLWKAIRERMGQYMVERLGLPADQVPDIRRHYFTTYGTTLRGLQRFYQVDADEYLAYVHDLPLESYIQPEPGLSELLSSLPQRRFIFTNADRDHARRVLATLQLTECFEAIIDVRAIEFACKPEKIAFERALQLAGGPAPQTCMLLDDSPSNLSGAQQLGFTTVLVGQADGPLHDPGLPAPDFCVSSLMQLPAALPDLWR